MEATRTAHILKQALQQAKVCAPFLQSTSSQMAALEQLSELFDNLTDNNPRKNMQNKPQKKGN